MSGIVLSASVRQNLLSLQSTADLLATTQNRLASGKKVNTALDNPTNFFTAAGLDSRAGDINNLLDGIGNGVQILQAANSGITSIQKLIDNAKSVASQVLQTTVGYSPKSTATSSVIPGATAADLRGAPTNALATGATISNDDTTNGSLKTVTAATKLVGTAGAGSNDLATAITDGSTLSINGKTITFSASQTTKTTDASGNVTIGIGAGSNLTIQDVLTSIDTITGTGTPSTVVSNNPSAGSKIVLSTGVNQDLTIAGSGNILTALGLSGGTTARTPGAMNGQTLTIGATGLNGAPTTIVFGDGTSGTVKSLNDLNAKLASNNLQATIDTSGRIVITTSNDAASATIGAISGTAASLGNAFNAVVGSPPIVDPVAQATRANLVNQFNVITNQINTTAQDSSYSGVNLLNGDTLKLVFNETGKSTLTIPGVTVTAASLGVPGLYVGTDFLDNGNTNKVLTALNNASTNLRSMASSLGSNLSIVQIRQDFAKSLINVLQTGSSNLTLADSNEEAANSQALSTRQSIAVSALALANQSQQSVLKLLQ